MVRWGNDMRRCFGCQHLFSIFTIARWDDGPAAVASIMRRRPRIAMGVYPNDPRPARLRRQPGPGPNLTRTWCLRDFQAGGGAKAWAGR